MIRAYGLFFLGGSAVVAASACTTMATVGETQRGEDAGHAETATKGPNDPSDGRDAAVDDARMPPGLTVLATGQARPRGIAASATHVYWASEGTDPSWADGSVSRIAKVGGQVEVLASAQPGASGIAVDAVSVYWTNANFGAGNKTGSVMKTSLTGGEVVILAGHLGYPLAIATLGANAYVTTNDRLLRVPLGGGDPMPIFSGGQGEAMTLAIDSQHVYDGLGLTKISFDGTNVVPLVAAGASSIGIAVDATDVYFIDNGALSKVSKNGGPVKKLGPDVGGGSLSSNPAGIALDETDVYVALGGSMRLGFADGAVIRVPKTGGPATVIASNQNDPAVIVVDETAVYWTNTGRAQKSGSVMRYAKP